jgi:hypothetical protein
MSRARTALVAVLLALAGCQRCGQKPQAPHVDSAPDAGAALSSRCASAQETIDACDDVLVDFAPGDTTVVRLCRLAPVDDGDDAPDGRTRVELRQSGMSVGCGQLSDVTSLAALCAGAREGEAPCLDKFTRDNLAPTPRFWAPKSFAPSKLIAFFGDALDSDQLSVEIVQVGRGFSHTVFWAEHGRTARPFVYSKLEDVDGDGVPEVLGWEIEPELDECQPYAPLAIFKLQGQGQNSRYARDDGLMEKWAREHGKAWRGAEPDASIRECDDSEPESSASDAPEGH